MGKAKQVGWNNDVVSPIILVSGTEDYLASRFIRSQRDSLKGKFPQIEITRIDGSAYSSGELLSLTAPSLFGEPRLVIIDSVERCTDALIEDGIDYLGEPTDDTVVLFRHGGGVRGKKLLDALKNSDLVTEVACLELKKDAERLAFATAEFTAAKKKITNAALRSLCEAFTEDLAELAAACEQLCQDVTTEITPEIVDKYYSGRVETSSYKVADAAISGNAGLALSLLRHALSSGIDPVPMVHAIAGKVRMLAKLHNNRNVSAAQLGAPPWAVEIARKESATWTSDGLAAVVQELAVCDAAAKGAERDSGFALERLLLLIVAKGKTNV